MTWSRIATDEVMELARDDVDVVVATFLRLSPLTSQRLLEGKPVRCWPHTTPPGQVNLELKLVFVSS